MFPQGHVNWTVLPLSLETKGLIGGYVGTAVLSGLHWFRYVLMITPILLCGGSGTRLWPLSRKSYPKQFVPLVGEETLFQASAQRLSGDGFAAPLVLTNSDFRFIVTEQMAAAGIDPGAILIGAQRDFCRQWNNQLEVTVPGNHFLQEDSPDAIGTALAAWREDWRIAT